jgi:hypothetical protein
MDPDPEPEGVILRNAGIGFVQLLLDRNGTLDGSDHALELGQDAITGRIGDPPAMVGNEPVHDLAMSRQAAERPDFIVVHQARITCHVSREDRCQMPLDFLGLRIHETLGAGSPRIVVRIQRTVQHADAFQAKARWSWVKREALFCL